MSALILNHEFLEAMFADLPDDAEALVCGFPGDPYAPPEYGWYARPWFHGRAVPSTLTTNTNNYVAVSSFRPDKEGQVRRRKDQFARMHASFIDDIGTKVSPARIRVPLSAEIETSPGNLQGYYFLTPSAGSDSRVIAERFIEQLVAAGLTTDGKDPGMKGVTRYGRLPVGVNGKRKYVEQLGRPFDCRVTRFEPERRYTVEELAQVYRLDLTIPRPRLIQALPDDAAVRRLDGFTDLMRLLSEAGLYLETRDGGTHHIICPWADSHTDRATTGTAVLSPSDHNRYAGGFKCHHGHCERRTMGDLYRWARAFRVLTAQALAQAVES